MKFYCKELSIEDSEIGLTVTFSDSMETADDDGKSYEEIINSIGQYVTIQRTFGEDEFDQDYYSIELSDFDKSGELESFSIELYKNKFFMKYGDEIIDIGLSIDEVRFNELKAALVKIVNKKGGLIVRE